MAKAKAKKHYRYIKRGEVIPRDAEYLVSPKTWWPYYDNEFPWHDEYATKLTNESHGPRTIRVEVKPRKA
jgi:hypothetical protein